MCEYNNINDFIYKHSVKHNIDFYQHYLKNCDYTHYNYSSDNCRIHIDDDKHYNTNSRQLLSS